MKKQKYEPLPHFDTYTVDFDSDDRPQCFHLFWRDVEVATVRLAYDANGYLSKAIRQGTREQRLVSLKELANLPFFTAYIHRINIINLIKEITLLKKLSEVTNVKKMERVDLIDVIGRINQIESATMHMNPIRNPFFRAGLEGWQVGGAGITLQDDPTFGKRISFDNAVNPLIQYLFADTDKYPEICFWAAKAPTGGAAYIRCKVTYTDTITSTFDKDLPSDFSWEVQNCALTAAKIIAKIEFWDLTGRCYMVFPQCIEA